MKRKELIVSRESRSFTDPEEGRACQTPLLSLSPWKPYIHAQSRWQEEYRYVRVETDPRSGWTKDERLRQSRHSILRRTFLEDQERRPKGRTPSGG